MLNLKDMASGQWCDTAAQEVFFPTCIACCQEISADQHCSSTIGRFLGLLNFDHQIFPQATSILYSYCMPSAGLITFHPWTNFPEKLFSYISHASYASPYGCSVMYAPVCNTSHQIYRCLRDACLLDLSLDLRVTKPQRLRLATVCDKDAFRTLLLVWSDKKRGINPDLTPPWPMTSTNLTSISIKSGLNYKKKYPCMDPGRTFSKHDN